MVELSDLLVLVKECFAAYGIYSVTVQPERFDAMEESSAPSRGEDEEEMVEYTATSAVVSSERE